MRWLFSWNSELCAGERFMPAGYRPAQAWVRAGERGNSEFGIWARRGRLVRTGAVLLLRFASVHVRWCGSGGAVCRRRMVCGCGSIAALCRWCMDGSCVSVVVFCALYRPALALLAGCFWRSAHAQPCRFLAGRFASGSRLALRLCRCVLHSVRAFAFLSQRFAAVHARRCDSIAGFCRRFTPGDAFLLRCFALGSRLSFFLCQEKRDGLR